MIKLKGNTEFQNIMVINPNESFDFVSSFEKKLNETLLENNEKTLGAVKITLGSSKASTDQGTKEYKGIEATATILKKTLASASRDQFFAKPLDRKVYHTYEGKVKVFQKRFDNHVKIRFRSRTKKEREALRIMLTLMFTFYDRELDCDVSDLESIQEIEQITDDFYSLDLFINVRTCLRWVMETSAAEYKSMLVSSGGLIAKAPAEYEELKGNTGGTFGNGF